MIKFFVPAALAAAALAAPAHAQDLSVSVGYGDLDLTSQTGVARLDRRIDAAVDRVCDDQIGQRSLSAVLATGKCARNAWADVETPRQLAIERARGRVPSVEIAGARAAGNAGIAVRRR